MAITDHMTRAEWEMTKRQADMAEAAEISTGEGVAGAIDDADVSKNRFAATTHYHRVFCQKHPPQKIVTIA